MVCGVWGVGWCGVPHLDWNWGGGVPALICSFSWYFVCICLYYTFVLDLVCDFFILLGLYC